MLGFVHRTHQVYGSCLLWPQDMKSIAWHPSRQLHRQRRISTLIPWMLCLARHVCTPYLCLLSPAEYEEHSLAPQPLAASRAAHKHTQFECCFASHTMLTHYTYMCCALQDVKSIA